MMAHRRKRSAGYVHPLHWTKRVQRGFRLAWLVICLAALGAWWLGWGFVDGAGQRIEHRAFLDAIMSVIAFPGGLLWVWLAPGLESWAGRAATSAGLSEPLWNDYGPELMIWSGATVIGYIQWFWLLPHVFTLRSDG